MKKYQFLSCVFFLFITLTNAQVKTKFNNNEFITTKGIFQKNYKESVLNLTVPTEQQIRDAEREDAIISTDRLFRIAIPINTDVDFIKTALWINDLNFSYGKLTLNATNAKSLSLNFNKFLLPEGTEMWIYNENGNMITGPISAKENNKNNIWGSSIYKGGQLSIELKVPSHKKNELVLNISNVAYGYKKIFYDRIYGFGNSDTCNINVLCPLGTGWEKERNSVALLLKGNGTILCSGAILNNTCGINIPYFLTANHCFEAYDNVAEWRFVFQYWSPQCSPSEDDLYNVLFNGSTLRARWDETDFCLVELNQTPHVGSGIHYAGWSRSPAPSPNATGIHHPSGDVMKISHDSDTITRWAGPYYNDSLYWRVSWNQGITEGGSSGSPLFNDEHRVIGQLRGGSSYCTSPTAPDYYGSFDQSWTGGGTNSTRLSNWLDPNNMNLFTTNTTNIADLIPTPATGLTILGKDSICSSEIYTVNVPTGTSVSFTVSVSPNSSYASYSASGNEISVTRNGSNIGTVKITATVTDDCGNQYEVNRTVYLGPIPAVIMGPYDPVEHTVMGVACVGEEYYFAPYSIDPTATYTWKFIPPVWSQDWEPTYLASGPYAYFTMPDTPRCYTVRVEKTNACGGTVVTQKKICVVECNAMRLLASPNPATSLLTVTLIDEKEKISKQIKQENIQIELYNLNVGIKQKEWKYNTTTQRQFTLNIADIAKGMYVVKVTKGKLQATIKIIKN